MLTQGLAGSWSRIPSLYTFFVLAAKTNSSASAPSSATPFAYSAKLLLGQPNPPQVYGKPSLLYAYPGGLSVESIFLPLSIPLLCKPVISPASHIQIKSPTFFTEPWQSIYPAGLNRRISRLLVTGQWKPLGAYHFLLLSCPSVAGGHSEYENAWTRI